VEAEKWDAESRRSLDLAGIKGAGVDFQFVDDSVKRIRSWDRPRCGGGEFVEVAANLEGAARGLPFREEFILNLVRLEGAPPGETATDFQTTSLLPIDIDGKATVGIDSRGYMGPLHQGHLSGRNTLAPMIVDENSQTDVPGLV